MKKIYSMLVGALLLLSGCDIHTTEVVKPGVDILTYYMDVKADEWGVEDTGYGYSRYFVFNIKELDYKVIEEGAVLVYMIDKDNKDNPLPYVFPVSNRRGDELMEVIRFNVSRGKVKLIIEWSDGGDYDGEDMRFKICLLAPGD